MKDNNWLEDYQDDGLTWKKCKYCDMSQRGIIGEWHFFDCERYLHIDNNFDVEKRQVSHISGKNCFSLDGCQFFIDGEFCWHNYTDGDYDMIDEVMRYR